MSLFTSSVANFMTKYGMRRSTRLRSHKLTENVQEFRLLTMLEEVTEYEEATKDGQPEDILDALLDLLYYTLGTAWSHGFTAEQIDNGFALVHAANMEKVKSEKVSVSGRGCKYDVVKPPGWEPPNLRAMLNEEMIRERKNKPLKK